jgi:acyl-coenzyme A synthetase/AMP-(fatty) acid ligase
MAHWMSDYERTFREHRTTVPETFNFGHDVVDAWARDPERMALLWCDADGNERRLSFAEVAEESDRVAAWLAARGVQRGERVIVMLPRIPEWQISMVACLKLGAVPIPCITMLTRRDVAYRVRHSGAVAAITVPEASDRFEVPGTFKAALCVGGAAPGFVDYALARTHPQRIVPVPLPAEAPAVMYYTSGSTGQPKGVMHAARGLYAWRVSARYWLSLDEHDVMWCTADTGWSKAGTSILFGPWSQGAAVLFHDGPFDARRRFELIARHGVTVFCAAATELRRLIREDVSDFDLSRLRLTVSAGESVNPEVLEAWQRLVKVPLLDGYGQTETLMTVLNYPGMAVKPGSMGRPLPGVDAAVLTDEGAVRRASARGRLVIRAPNPQLMLGYWGDAERTAAQFTQAEGARWFVTGDTVTADEDGYLFYLGRDDDVIGSSGYRIGPQEVENALIEHPAVQESAVIGVPDAERGEVVKAFVVLAPGHTGDGALVAALQAHVRSLTAPYKYPRLVEFVDDLPKTVSGKIQRALLRQREGDRRGGASGGA